MRARTWRVPFEVKLWLRPLPFALALAYALARAGTGPVDDAAPSRSAALCSALAARAVRCQPDDVTWIDDPPGALGAAAGKPSRALVRGSGKGEGSDPSDEDDALEIFVATARLSPEGRVLDVEGIHDLSHTSGADDGMPVVHGTKAAYVVNVNGRPQAVHVLDLSGREPRDYDDLSRFQRFQVKVNDLQATGQSKGVRRTVYALSPPPKTCSLSWSASDKGVLSVKTDQRTIEIDAEKASVVAGSAYVRAVPEVVSKPPTFAPWMSDRLRAASWFGDEKNQFVKMVVFTANEWLKGTKSKLTGDTGEKDAQEDIGSLAGKVEPASFTDPDTGWPPKALEPLVKPALPNEGQWVALEKDPFITPVPRAPALFLTTFVRSDPSAPQTRVYVTLWDPRLVALHMEAGTVEPVGPTGEAGPGVIPRTPEVMKHVVAGFNGGFQATHGEFGMQADGVLYLPPKPYAATVAELRDGTTAFGAWPDDEKVPDEVLSFRQNLSPLVQNDKYNPWQRAWWGGVPPGWHDAIHTTRSGLCLTKEGFVGYFYGNDIGPEPLGRAMLVARCAFGMHLDMNPGLAGFEFYDIQPAQTYQPLGRPLQPDWEFEGSVKDMPDLKFRSRRMIKSMGHMLFPRYIHRDGRDFFYLTSRSILPGAPPPNLDGELRTKGLPQHGYPYALALGHVKEGDKRFRLVRIDPRTVRSDDKDDKDTVLLFGYPPSLPSNKKHAHTNPSEDVANAKKLFLGPHVFAIEKTAPAGAVALADVLPLGATTEARAAVGISDEDGMLQWIELAPDAKPDAATAEAMLKVLERIGCGSRGLVAGGLRAFPGGSLDAGGDAAVPPTPAARLVRTPAPSGRMMFESTPIVSPSVWTPLQQKKVKWRPTLAPPDKPAASGSAATTPSAP
jgi:hypothetical protein